LKSLNWDDLKIVYRVALSGSIAKAAEGLSINYSTVLRHINRLEKALACKLFIRHQRGYQLTDTGKDFLAEMPEIESKLFQLQAKLANNDGYLSGTLKITTLPEYSAFLHPVLVRSQQQYPKLNILVDVCDDLVALESGNAHISIRAGQAPDKGDLIASKITDLNFSYYASTAYVENNGLPSSNEKFNQHQWVMPCGKKKQLSFIKSVLSKIDPIQIRYQSNNFYDIQSAIEHGIGIGPVDDQKAKYQKGLIKVHAIDDLNDSALWFVYHRDMRNDKKIKGLLNLIKES